MQRAKKPSKRKSTATRKKLTCEALEDRRVLATVTLNTDTGAAGELRTELAGAAPGEVIDFNLPAGNETIVLSGELVLDKDISIDGLNSAGSGVSVTLDAAGTSRVLNVDDGDDANSLSVSLSNLTITGGDTSTQPLDVVDGGGIRNFESLSITDSVITGNSSADDGGGIFSNGTLAISGTSIDANTAEDRAAGLFGYGEISITDNSSISGNMIVSDGDALGVGALFGAGSVTTIDGATINNNIGESTYYDPVSMTEDDGRGSGIYVSGFGDAIPTSLTITNSTFDGNTTDGQGGAIQAGIAVTLTIEDSTFTNNTAGGDAGAIGTSSFGVDSGAVTTIRRTTISGNSAGDDAGGIEPTGGVALYLEDSLLENNYAYDRGGAIYARGQDAVLDSTIVITGTTFIGNRAIDDGGGLHASPNVQLTVDDSDFMGNTAVSRGAAIRFSFADDPGEGSVGLITNSRITGNMTDDDGGAGYVGQGFDATFENATIENNESLDGGAVSSPSTTRPCRTIYLAGSVAGSITSADR